MCVGSAFCGCQCHQHTNIYTDFGRGVSSIASCSRGQASRRGTSHRASVTVATPWRCRYLLGPPVAKLNVYRSSAKSIILLSRRLGVELISLSGFRDHTGCLHGWQCEAAAVKLCSSPTKIRRASVPDASISACRFLT